MSINLPLNLQNPIFGISLDGHWNLYKERLVSAGYLGLLWIRANYVRQKDLFVIFFQLSINAELVIKRILVEAHEIVNLTLCLRNIRKLIMILKQPVSFNKNLDNEIVQLMEIR